MKKSLFEAAPLSPGEESILKMYPDVAPAIRNTLSSLRRNNPGITIQQAAQQLGQVPQFQGNAQLSALAGMKNQSVQSSGQVAQMFAKNPVQKVAPPPAQVMNYNPIQAGIQKSGGYDPIQHSQNLAKEMVPRQQQPQQQPPAPQQPNKPPALSRQAQRNQRVGNKDTMKMEAFNFGSSSNSLQKIMKVVSTLRPEEVQMLLKMLTSVMGGQPQSPNSTGMASMTKSTITSSQKYTQRQLLETLKKDILKEEMIQSIKTQTQNYKLMESMLVEGPFSNVWQGLKNAGTSVLNKIKSIGGDQTALATGQVSPEEQSKAYSGEMMKAIKKAHQTRQQFKSQVLKNAEIINAYHDAVSEVWQSFGHVSNSLGPHSGQIKSQVDELVSNLKYDLESEKEQIQSFLKVLGDLRGGMQPDSGMARGNAEFKRDQEAQARRRMKNPITGGRMGDSRVDPEIVKDIDGMNDDDAVFDLVNRKVKGDKNINLSPSPKKRKPRAKATPKPRAAARVKKTKEKHE